MLLALIVCETLGRHHFLHVHFIVFFLNIALVEMLDCSGVGLVATAESQETLCQCLSRLLNPLTVTLDILS